MSDCGIHSTIMGWAVVTAGGNIRRWWREKPEGVVLLKGEQFIPLRPIDAIRGMLFTKASLDVAAERNRQKHEEGWTPEHDDLHSRGQLATAAACYAIHESHLGSELAIFWPWELSWWKPTNRRRDLIKAGALILAEIDRIDRAAAIQADRPSEGPARSEPAGDSVRAED